MEISGKIIDVLPERGGISQRSGSEWKVASYLLETFEQYPKKCCFEVFGSDRIQQFNIHQGDTVHIWLDINARPWQDKYITDISCYQCDHIDPNAVNTGAAPAQPASQLGAAPAAPAQSAAPAATAQPTAAQDPLGGDSSDDLPF